jgi:hypothetical protein
MHKIKKERVAVRSSMTLIREAEDYEKEYWLRRHFSRHHLTTSD